MVSSSSTSVVEPLSIASAPTGRVLHDRRAPRTGRSADGAGRQLEVFEETVGQFDRTAQRDEVAAGDDVGRDAQVGPG